MGEGAGQRARRELLIRLLERYERSRMYGAPAPWPRNVILRLDRKEFPSAFAPDGSQELADIAHAAQRLEAEGALRLAYFKGLPHERPREARLGPAEVDRAYALAATEAGFQPLAQCLEKLATTCSQLVERSPEAPAWMKTFLERFAAGARSADLSAGGMSRERFKRDCAEVLDALAAAAALASGVDGWERVVSERIFMDSKRLGAIRGTVRDILLSADPRWDGVEAEDAREVLESYGVRRKPGVIQCAGRAEIFVQGRRYCLEDFAPVAHLPEEWSTRWAEGIVQSSPRWITTIENEFPFLSYVLEAGGPYGLADRSEVAVYTSGFPGRALLESLVAIGRSAPSIEFRHWGDADGGGLRIWWHLRSHIARPVLLFRTGRDWLEAEAANGREITSFEQQGLGRLAAEIRECPAASEPDVQEALHLIDALLRLGRKVEQERW
jgi:hypothetical protein